MTGAPVVKTLHAPSQDSSVVVDEATKLQLAMRVSQVAMVPGAVTLNGINQLSYGQKEEISNLRHIQKSRAAYRDDSSSIQPPTTLSAINEEDPLDVLQTRMNEFQNVESRNIEIDDAVQRKQTKRSCGMIAVLVVLAVAVVAGVVAVIVIVVTLGSRNQEGIHDTLADDEREEDDDIKATMKGFNECFMGNTTLASHPQHGLLTTAAFRVLPSIEGDLNTTGSSQRAAFCWLSEVDSYVLVQPNEALIPYELVQRFALATIFFHFNGTLNDDSSNLVELNWLMHVHVCWWPSVACNGLGNEVTDLHLDTLPLNTVIPKELALLSNLTDLKLTACGLRGRIPSELSNLSHLEHVAMDGNELTGEITLNFTNMPQLMLLDLTNNYLSGEIPPQFYEIPNLQVANLGWNKFTGTLVASGLSNATGLTRFAVDYNQLTGNIPDISRLTKMEFLGMSYNQLHGTFPDVSRMTNLILLDLAALDLTGTIEPLLWFFPKLKSLNLESTRISGTIPAAVGLLSTLESLELTATMLSGRIPSELGDLSDLKFLSLDYIADLTGTVPSELGRLLKLETLRLPTSSGLSGIVPSEICQLLREYSLSSLAGPCEMCECCSCSF